MCAARHDWWRYRGTLALRPLSLAEKIIDLVDIGVQERWLTRRCMDHTLGLEFEAAADEAMAYIASVAPSFEAFKVGIN